MQEYELKRLIPTLFCKQADLYISHQAFGLNPSVVTPLKGTLSLAR